MVPDRHPLTIYSQQYNINRNIIGTEHYRQYKYIYALKASADCLSDHPPCFICDSSHYESYQILD